MRTSLALPLLSTLVFTVGSGGESAARPGRLPTPRVMSTCADFPNQAAAQRAANTRDGDGDGIYCDEALPCPCLRPGQTGGSPQASKPSTAPTRHSLGRSVTLHPVTKHTGCSVRGPRPDPACTPGAYYAKATKVRVCVSGYSKAVRNVSQAAKDDVYAAYGIGTHFNGASGEVDPLVSLELGGSNVRANLFPESATPRPGSHEKDKLENRLHREVCSGQITLRKAQREIAGNWVTVYHHEFG
jgi:hypothetical protein